MVEADDIDKPNEAYSIEDAKLKTEEDARQALAEDNKAKQREKIAELRSRYMLLVEVSASHIFALPFNSAAKSFECSQHFIITL